MRLILTYLLFSVVVPNSTAQQNFIPNPSFELMDTCPVGVMGYTLLNWFSPTDGTPDQFTVCASGLGARSVPQSDWGFQYPKEGNAYGAIYLCDPIMDSIREYIAVKLTQPLKKGMRYCLTFYASGADNSPSTISTFGACFSADSIFQNGIGILPFLPQVENDTANYLDTVSWKAVTGNFYAIGGEEYMYIGNFKTNANTNVIHQSNSGGAYILIDNFSLVECDSLAGVNEYDAQQITLFPNPATGTLNIIAGNLQNAEIELFDISGRKLFQQNLTADQQSIDVSGYTNGIYICTITANGKVVRREKVVISR
jgi:hypothetical protein